METRTGRRLIALFAVAFAAVIAFGFLHVVRVGAGRLRSGAPAAAGESTSLKGLLVRNKTIVIPAVVPNSTPVATFELMNERSDPVDIDAIAVSCGCLNVRGAPRVIPPHSVAKIPVTINTSGVQAQTFDKQVVVRLGRPALGQLIEL